MRWSSSFAFYHFTVVQCIAGTHTVVLGEGVVQSVQTGKTAPQVDV